MVSKEGDHETCGGGQGCLLMHLHLVDTRPVESVKSFQSFIWKDSYEHMSTWSLSAVAFMRLTADCIMLVNIDDWTFYGVCFESVTLRECWLIIYTLFLIHNGWWYLFIIIWRFKKNFAGFCNQLHVEWNQRANLVVVCGICLRGGKTETHSLSFIHMHTAPLQWQWLTTL